MPLLSIIACGMFEDEITHLIENDKDISSIFIVKNENCIGLTEKLDTVCVEYAYSSLEDIPSLPGRSDNDNFTLVVNILELALDASPERLKDEVYEVVQSMSDFSDGVLVFYGLCGNVLGNIESDLSSTSCPVHILKDEYGNIVDDCICASLGSGQVYAELLTGDNRGEGTYFLTPMQAAHWREMVVIAKLTPDPDNIEMTKAVFDYSGYCNVGKIDTGLSYEAKFDDQVAEFAELFDLDLIEIKGNTRIVDESYRKLRLEVLMK
ncbi:MAG: DUF1638 domain-containing protein [Methanosarcinaceae archaeon]|nr:DUF1638 domain-containing protein [Methanosarcinaceae archaeon]